jgi:energy-coupling factor transport system ATP-binding protein
LQSCSAEKRSSISAAFDAAGDRRRELAVLETEDLTYTYSVGTPFEKTAVNNVSLKIEEGEMIGVMGHTGSGKSTLIQHFNGLLRPTSGRILLDGKDIWADKNDIRSVRFKVGLVFQYPEYQIFEETVYKDIAFGPTNMGLDKTEIDRRVRETAHDLGLSEELMERSPFELSGGQKRRVAIAGVMAMEPRVLILDEPTAGLDPAGRDKILSHIKSYHERTRNTILIVSHSMEDIATFADRILVMNKSELFCFDETKKVFARADEIAAIGLDVPQITKVFGALRSRGLDFGKEVYTVGYARELVLRELRERGGL